MVKSKLKYDLSQLLIKSLLSPSISSSNYAPIITLDDVAHSELKRKISTSDIWKKLDSNHWDLEVGKNYQGKSRSFDFKDGNLPLIVTPIEPIIRGDLSHLVKIETELSDIEVFKWGYEKKRNFWGSQKEILKKVTTYPTRIKVTINRKSKPDLQKLFDIPKVFCVNENDVSFHLNFNLAQLQDLDKLVLTSSNLLELKESYYNNFHQCFCIRDTEDVSSLDFKTFRLQSLRLLSEMPDFQNLGSLKFKFEFQSTEKYVYISMGSLSTLLTQDEYQKLLNKVDGEKLKRRLKDH